MLWYILLVWGRNEWCNREMVQQVVFGLLAEQKEPDLEGKKLELATQVSDRLALVDTHTCISLYAKSIFLFEWV